MSAPGNADLARRLLRARSFLYGRQAVLYGGRSVRFDLEKGYWDFDGMLKRTLYYARFAVREVVAEARADIHPDSAVLQVHRMAGLTPTQGGASRFEDFLRSQRLLAAPGAPPRQVKVAGRLHEILFSRPGPSDTDQLELRLLPTPEPGPGAGPEFRPSLRALREEWIITLLKSWIGTGSPLQLDGGEQPLFRPRTLAFTVSRRISQVDIDISGEADPHVFRWKEASLAKASTFADLDDADIAAVLAASGILLPGNSRLEARLRENLGQGGVCLLLRYAHLIPDPDPAGPAEPGADGNAALVPPWLNAGSIVMENDFLEILIDAGRGAVFSEARKWRPEPGLPARIPAPELAGAGAP